MGRQIVSGSCHLVEWKNDDSANLRRLSPNREELNLLSRVCTTTLCPTFHWLLVMWKGNDAHMSPIGP
ncbi:unnamed protein product [Spirodela intermedia]|uniref:Uncharacterized protein n=2 Tax=Spirodela intermedia TaxID=51605 RepID=A0A7I8JUF3_SPIIN|nr:unnamed protein product [Spirodela intermedia]CAA6673385.1 unnamed protein product [Spirodela intermedia]CAA7410614.1 unnamed protein product [Spirodela intermedia]